MRAPPPVAQGALGVVGGARGRRGGRYIYYLDQATGGSIALAITRASVASIVMTVSVASIALVQAMMLGRFELGWNASLTSIVRPRLLHAVKTMAYKIP